MVASIALLFGLFAGACAPGVVRTDVYRDATVQIRLQHSLDKDKKAVDRGFDHPLAISPEAMSRVLRSIQVEYHPGLLRSLLTGNRGKPARAFSDDEIAGMAVGLSEAFSRATPADRIEFVVRHKKGVFAAGISTGVMNAKDGRIELIFGNYKANPIPKGDHVDPERQDPLENIGVESFEIVPGPHQDSLDAAEGGPAGRGLSIDFGALTEPLPEGGASAEAEAPTGEAIEHKLEILKRLREKGLITEEEYRQKKQELLEAY